ncbi:IS3 family transposase [Streptococcus tangpeifui]|uniref:IS3 family transposase n=1 Tax=Streptococcus tangpeifui TaxID=2709400 RepID=UPI0013ED5C18
MDWKLFRPLQECYTPQLNTYKTFEELVTYIDTYIHFYTNYRYQEKHNGLAPLELRNKAIA